MMWPSEMDFSSWCFGFGKPLPMRPARNRKPKPEDFDAQIWVTSARKEKGFFKETSLVQRVKSSFQGKLSFQDIGKGSFIGRSLSKV